MDALSQKGAQQQDHDQISVSPKVGGPGAEVTNQQVVFVLGHEVGHGLFDFGTGELFEDILGRGSGKLAPAAVRHGSPPPGAGFIHKSLLFKPFFR
jgi:hypothetical protein